MPNIIVLFGHQQVGKSTTARSLADVHDYRRVSFADPLYAMVGALLGITPEEARKLPKEEPIPGLDGKTLRFTLQTLGTEWGREMISSSLWLNTARRTINRLTRAGSDVVVDDCRFEDEYRMLLDLGAKFILLSRDDMPEQSNPEHASEQDWHHFKPDAAVLNQGYALDQWLELAGSRVLSALGL